MKGAIRTIAFGLLLVASVVLGAETKTITGRVSCSMCRGKHELGKKTDAECVRACVKYGAKYVVLSDDRTYILVGDPRQFDYYADQIVTIRGEIEQDRIVKIEAISVKK